MEEWLRYGVAGEPRLLHVPLAALGQAALLRRHPAGDRRVSAAARRLQPAGEVKRGQSARQPGLERPSRRAARAGLAGVLHPAAEPGLGGQRLGQGDSLGVPEPPPAGRDAPSASRCSTGCAATRSTTTRTSSGRRSGSARPTPREHAAFADLVERLKTLPIDCEDGELIQTEVYAAGKAAGFEPLRDWFGALYEVLLGESQGPRFGSFAAIFGLSRTIGLIERALAGEDLAATN